MACCMCPVHSQTATYRLTSKRMSKVHGIVSKGGLRRRDMTETVSELMLCSQVGFFLQSLSLSLSLSFHVRQNHALSICGVPSCGGGVIVFLPPLLVQVADFDQFAGSIPGQNGPVVQRKRGLFRHTWFCCNSHLYWGGSWMGY